ncbi:DUF4157 domain-containing protein [Streptomyces sp. NPDC006660]|uniref:eCIS core domain-containing protein n=1 Tax=Streptomyces sp. NPDC006660 TaxID=3156901 RepID=UPI0033DDD527
MRANDQTQTPVGKTPARSAARVPGRGSGTAAGLLALHGTAGNAAVVQMLRAAGHTWAQPEQHQHGAGCGHQQPSVQRSAVHDVLRSGGQTLDDATRADMEGRLGADFSDVRIHNDSAARASAAEVGARAYTSGNHVVIGEGGGDKHTLAHELTHVIQQRRGPVAGTDNGQGLSVSDPGDRFEREAEANATRVMRSGTSLTQHTEAPAEGGAGPVEGAVQRRVSVRDAQNPESKRDLGNEQSVREFLGKYSVSITKTAETILGDALSMRASATVEFKATEVIAKLVGSETELSYEDSKVGAAELANVICMQVIQSLSGVTGQSARPTPTEMLRQMNQRQPSVGNFGQSLAGPGRGQAPGGPGRGFAADPLSKFARKEMAERTPENPFLTGLGSGVQSAVTGRVDALTQPLPSVDNLSEVARWGAWVMLEGEDTVRRKVEDAARQVSPEEGRKLMSQFNDSLESKKRELEGTVVGSGAAGAAIGAAANAIPHPGIKVAAKVTSTVLGGVATAQKAGQVADVLKQVEDASPDTYAKLRAARDQALDQATSTLSQASSRATMDQVHDLGNQF